MTLTSIRIVTEDLEQCSRSLGQACSEYDNVIFSLVSIAARFAPLAAVDSSGCGAQTLVDLGEIGAAIGADAVAVTATARSVQFASDNYQRAEESANHLLNSLFGHHLSTEETTYVLDRTLLSEQEYIKRHIGQYTYVGAYALYATSGHLSEAGHPEIAGIGYTTAVAMFGFGYYLDTKLNGGAFANRRLKNNLETIFGHEVDDLTQTTDEILRQAGAYGTLDHAQAVDPSVLGKEYETDLNDPAVLARNLQLTSNAAENFDTFQAEHGAIEMYSSIGIQKVVDSPTGEIKVVVYLPGTDFGSAPVKGEVLGTEQTIQQTQMDTGTTYENAFASTQLIEQALRQAGIDPGTSLMMVGHSQGAMAAFNAASSPFLSQKYKVQQVYGFGGPTGSMHRAPGTTYTEIRQVDDSVPILQGNSAEHENGTDDRVIYVDSIEETTFNPVKAHDMSQYIAAVENPDSSLVAGRMQGTQPFLTGAAASSASLLTAGSTMPVNSTPENIRNRRVEVGLSVADQSVQYSADSAVNFHTDEMKSDAKEKMEGISSSDANPHQEPALSLDSGIEKLKDFQGKVDKTSGIVGEVSTGFDLITEDNDGLEDAAPETQQVLKAYNVQETLRFTGDKVSEEIADSLPKPRVDAGSPIAMNGDVPADSWWAVWNTPTRPLTPVPAL